MLLRFTASLLGLCFSGHHVRCADPVRLPWTSSRIQGSPEPAKPYAPEPVYPGLEVAEGLELVSHRGRFFVVERGGKIWSFAESGDGSGADLFADLKAGREGFTNAYGLAFHPRAAENRTVFLTYTIGNEIEDGTKLSRFRVSESDPPKLLPETEEVLLTWRSGGHNGAHLQFGPDGMLYISTGDATAPSPPDGLKTGQDNSDFLSAILRIDVDRRDPGLTYAVPPDNPWVGKEGVRPEIWAFGFRNPWKMSFHTDGRLWVGDVGWELWEMIHLVGKGGNHGWSAMEASQPILPATASPLAPITPPVAAHPHSEAASITGGFVYQGARLPELRGAYVYADYETGKVWAIWHDGRRMTRHEEIADTPHKIVTFGTGSDGELYYLHYGSPTTAFRLAKNPKAGKPTDFPHLLSGTGLFRDTAAEIPADGVYEYEVTEPMWEDGATARRWIALPDKTTIATAVANRRYTVTWPEGAVLARTVRIGKRPFETQVLHRDGETWNGYSYRWNAEATDAELVGAAGAEVEVPSGGWKGGPRYRIASRAECLRCHTSWNEFVNGFQPVQLAGFPAFPGLPAREAAAALGVADANYFERDPGGRLVESNGRAPLETRARSWLHANCAHCHRRHGGGSAPLEVNFDRPLSEANLLWQTPTRGDFGMTGSHAVTPGEPWRSVLVYRISSVGSGHMPPLGSHEVDPRGAKLLWDWIAAMPRETPVADDAVTSFLKEDLAHPASAMRLAHAVASGTIPESSRGEAIKAGLASEKPEIRALFERFRDPSARPRPRNHDPEAILARKGDPDKGAKLLSPAGKLAACLACHRLGGTGLAFGPDLDGVGSRLEPRALLESLLDPSRVIAPENRLWSVELKSGESLAGLILARDADGFTLRSGPGLERRLGQEEVKRTLPQDLSAMPAGLVDALEPGEIADLLAWLASRKGQ
jgi:putative heme-binding domain-containing protein